MRRNNPGIYGTKPYSIAVIHGGPGAAGDVAPLAKEISERYGVLEPLQTKMSVKGQVSELHTILTKYAELPVTLIGHSWGAMLSFIFCAEHPSLVRKLILIGCGPFEEKYFPQYRRTIMARLKEVEKKEAESLELLLRNSSTIDQKENLMRLGELMSGASSYDPLPYDNQTIEFRPDIYRKVWAEAKSMRKSGELVRLGYKIRCPVIVIHGDYDPHPIGGVKKPLLKINKRIKFILLEKCGHYPWYEKRARDEFFSTIYKFLK